MKVFIPKCVERSYGHAERPSNGTKSIWTEDEEKSQIDNLNSQFRNVDKVRIRAEIDEIKNKRMIKKISETQNCF